MMPGGRMNPRQMKAMMKRMGISQDEVRDVEEVVIRTRDREIVFKDAAVTVMSVQGQKSYQIVGNPTERERTPGEAGADVGPPREDVKLVMEQTGCTEAEARKALEDAEGAPAEAILKIMSTR
jgi:nascent polypeptide-associated complex subunit alpha